MAQHRHSVRNISSVGTLWWCPQALLKFGQNAKPLRDYHPAYSLGTARGTLLRVLPGTSNGAGGHFRKLFFKLVKDDFIGQAGSNKDTSLFCFPEFISARAYPHTTRLLGVLQLDVQRKISAWAMRACSVDGATRLRDELFRERAIEPGDHAGGTSTQAVRMP